MRPDPPRDQGFTLLEVLIAFIIAAMSLAILFRTAIEGQTAVAVAARYQEALSQARSRLAAVEATPLVAGDREGVEGGGYRWRVRIVPLAEGAAPAEGAPALVLFGVSVAVTWGTDDDTARTIRLETRRLGLAPPRAP